MSETTREIGRPKKTLAELPEGWQVKMADKAREGASQLQVRVEVLGISQDLWARFIKEEKEFADIVRICKGLCQAYWEVLGNDLSKGAKEGSAAVWIFNMKNRFGWKDKVEYTEGDPAASDKAPEDVNWDDPLEAEKAWRRSQRQEEPK